ncbi:metal-binding protein [Cyanobium sp. NIES-981]|uniref:metal-binding protein n=1 Tax=Cyanobium sp. NIES-981 TaxID=1851505 RepID=UPI000B355A00|nr:metal-binding protein [Cyanobium sp. NIES-981]
MASGRRHDRATLLLALPFALFWAPGLGPAGVAVAGVSFLAGGLLLSPDLDTLSNPARRWGPLRLLWWPYRKVLSHRSLLSHSPLLGTAGRLGYLALLALVLTVLLAPLGGPAPAALLGGLAQLWSERRALVITALVGLEASSWLHLIQDGDPLPRLPRLLRRRASRRSGRRHRSR